MRPARVFVVYHFGDIAHRDYQFAIRLINDLRASGVDVVTKETTVQDGNFVQFLNEMLPTCQWLILVQTSEALRSPQVQMAVNTALTLVVQQRMRGVLPVIAAPCEPQEVPVTWATLKTYDATQDYQRTLTRILLTLGLDPVLSGKHTAVAPPPSRVSASPSPIDRPIAHPRKPDLPGTYDSSAEVDRPEKLTPVVTTFERTSAIPKSHPDRENHQDTPVPLSLSTRQHRNRWLTAISVALALVVLITGVVLATRSFSKSSPNLTATTTASALTELNVRATANANATVDANLSASARNAFASVTARDTATARAIAAETAVAQANATATANANATATAIAKANATSTAIAVANPYPPSSGQLVLSDPLNNNGRGYGWEEIPLNTNGGSCQFSGNAYVATAPPSNYRPCHSTTLMPSNLTFEVRMQIIAGNCGGISLRDTTAKANSYYFMVCRDGTYGFFRYDGFTVPVQTLRSGPSTAIITGLNQFNLLAVVANGSNFELYVNHQRIDSVSDSTYSQGEFGVSADGGTTTAYTFARMWTL